MLAKPAGMRCQQMQSPTEVHQISPILYLVLTRRRSSQLTSTNSMVMPGVAGVNMPYQASALNWWSVWTEPALCQQQLSRHCQIRHSMTPPMQACACHTLIECDTQMGTWQLRSYMACASSLSCWHDASRRTTAQAVYNLSCHAICISHDVLLTWITNQHSMFEFISGV